MTENKDILPPVRTPEDDVREFTKIESNAVANVLSGIKDGHYPTLIVFQRGSGNSVEPVVYFTHLSPESADK